MTKGFFFDGDIKDEVWKKEWKNMPEFVQEDVSPFKAIMVNFENKQDMEAFAKLVGQGITMKTQSIYYHHLLQSHNQGHKNDSSTQQYSKEHYHQYHTF